ncbi:ATP-dependent helicase [Pseudolysinimonas sp.]|uniref:ATP-dependent helicase n=1 Tax=Pseudolysinimonas sp. TaxID=2680009 RepID=UPI003F806E9C
MVDLLADLDAEQRTAAETLLGPVCILAGAGTGKTRALTHRIAHGVQTGAYDPARVMALTFTTRAAGELRTRLRQLGAAGVNARTFHAAALAQLSHFWPQAVGGQLPRILESKGRLLGQAAEQLRFSVDTAALRDAAAEIEWRKVSRMPLAQYARAAESRSLPQTLPAGRMTALQERYERLKDEARRIDFEDVLLATAGMLDSEPWIAEQVRAQYRFFVVDEYQDVSPLQQQLLELWLGSRRELCVVGDANQTIYSFTGATSDYLLNFATRWEGAQVVRLERNYRSAPPVLALANRLMRGRPGALELTPAGEPARRSAEIDPPVAYDTDLEEARAVASAVAAEIAAGTRPERIAVLYRVNAQAALLEQALAAVGVGARQQGATKFFDLPDVKLAIVALAQLARDAKAAEAPLFQSVSDVVRDLGWTTRRPEGGGATQEKWEALNAIVELADSAPEGTTLARFAEELQHRQAAQHEPTIAAVVLSTLHGSKGLEWDSVHLVGLSEGLLPISHASGLAAIDEERRLLYVGITRARRRLALSWAREGMRGRPREPSRFLAELRTSTRDAAPTRRR